MLAELSGNSAWSLEKQNAKEYAEGTFKEQEDLISKAIGITRIQPTTLRQEKVKDAWEALRNWLDALHGKGKGLNSFERLC